MIFKTELQIDARMNLTLLVKIWVSIINLYKKEFMKNNDFKNL